MAMAAEEAAREGVVTEVVASGRFYPLLYCNIKPGFRDLEIWRAGFAFLSGVVAFIGR